MFESESDLTEFMAQQATADEVSGDAASVRPLARTSTKTRASAASREAIARALERKAAARDAARKVTPARTGTARRTGGAGAKPARQGTRSKPPSVRLSDLVEPGLYHGPPWRAIVYKPTPREVDVSRAVFRRQRHGVGKCTGNKLKAASAAFANAYFLVESARQEVSDLRRNPDARILWHASLTYPEASLAHWFGADYDGRQMGRMLVKIERILHEWALAFCSGFRDLAPVWIRCKSKNGVGGGPARHISANMIELFPRYFEMSREKRIVTMLHEMGHRSTSLTKPRDERHDLCNRGWNRKQNMCYREPDQPEDRSRDRLFHSGNPRTLAEAAEGGNVSARKAALNNIDNYVSYMWNRDIDRHGHMMQLLEPGAKPPRRRMDRSNSEPPSR